MSVRSAILPALTRVGVILDGMGFHQFDVLLRVVTWSGERPGLGTRTTTDTPLTLNGTARPAVIAVSSHDIIASGGKYTEGDYHVGPFQPLYNGGGYSSTLFTPTQPNAEMFYRITGPGFEGGAWFKKIDQRTDKVLAIMLTLRATSVTP